MSDRTPSPRAPRAEDARATDAARCTNADREPATFDQLVDEVCGTGFYHLEMLGDEAAHLQLGARVFVVFAAGGTLYVRYQEDRPASDAPAPPRETLMCGPFGEPCGFPDKCDGAASCFRETHDTPGTTRCGDILDGWATCALPEGHRGPHEDATGETGWDSESWSTTRPRAASPAQEAPSPHPVRPHTPGWGGDL